MDSDELIQKCMMAMGVKHLNANDDELLLAIQQMVEKYEELEMLLKDAIALIYQHHEVGHIVKTYKNLGKTSDCDVCKSDKRFEALLNHLYK